VNYLRELREEEWMEIDVHVSQYHTNVPFLFHPVAALPQIDFPAIFAVIDASRCVLADYPQDLNSCLVACPGCPRDEKQF
jgi:hypothetical protein